MELRKIPFSAMCLGFCVLQCCAFPALVKRDVSSFLAEQMAKAKHDDPPTAPMSAADTEDAARDKIRQQALAALQHSQKDSHASEAHHEHHANSSAPQFAEQHLKDQQPARKESHHAKKSSVPAAPVPVVRHAADQDSAAQPSHVEKVPHLHGEMASLKNFDIIEDTPPAHANATKAA
ncbi:hypothetical protein RvY_18606 [Ramazzottius varieornatus]|uniref:Uncharacterized protein n=1 Tax=Ramazzottius varieornatus TaxID=947166 RepID=A0A1D1W6P7_RAMVA|nr:hypothetical protein RvY_18606 [Ramazzottius varieornatus]